MSIQDAIAEQAAARKGLRASAGKIGQVPTRKRTKTYTEKQHQAAIDAAVNDALEEAAQKVWAKLGIALAKRTEADLAMVHIRSIKRI